MAVTPKLNLYLPSDDDYVSNERDVNENYTKIDNAFSDVLLHFDETSDLNTLFSRTETANPFINGYGSGAQNKPDTNSGFVITCILSNGTSWAVQYAFTVAGEVFTRNRNNSGIVSSWTKIYQQGNIGEFSGYSLGTSSGVHRVGYTVLTPQLKLAELGFDNLTTGAQLNVGTEYSIGNITFVPRMPVYFYINRTDSGNAVAMGLINTSGQVRLRPLVQIPSGVVLGGHVMYYYS